MVISVFFEIGKVCSAAQIESDTSRAEAAVLGVQG